MPISTISAASAAIRDLAGTTRDAVTDAARATLQHHVEHLLFKDARFGPSREVLRDSLELLASRKDLRELADSELYGAWSRCVDVAHGAALMALEHEFIGLYPTFTELCSRSFGVPVERVSRLFREFHDLEVGQRFGVLVLLSRSASFRYLSREIDDFTGAVDLDSPGESLRTLIRRTLAVY